MLYHSWPQLYKGRGQPHCATADKFKSLVPMVSALEGYVDNGVFHKIFPLDLKGRFYASVPLDLKGRFYATLAVL